MGRYGAGVGSRVGEGLIWGGHRAGGCRSPSVGRSGGPRSCRGWSRSRCPPTPLLARLLPLPGLGASRRSGAAAGTRRARRRYGVNEGLRGPAGPAAPRPRLLSPGNGGPDRGLCRRLAPPAPARNLARGTELGAGGTGLCGVSQGRGLPGAGGAVQGHLPAAAVGSATCDRLSGASEEERSDRQPLTGVLGGGMGKELRERWRRGCIGRAGGNVAQLDPKSRAPALLAAHCPDTPLSWNPALLGTQLSWHAAVWGRGLRGAREDPLPPSRRWDLDSEFLGRERHRVQPVLPEP